MQAFTFKSTPKKNTDVLLHMLGFLKKILTKAITKGGTTLRDYVSGDGLPGYFANELKVYNRSGELCSKCKKKIKKIKQNQRSTFYCAFCQT